MTLEALEKLLPPFGEEGQLTHPVNLLNSVNLLNLELTATCLHKGLLPSWPDVPCPVSGDSFTVVSHARVAELCAVW